jgi:IclR family transcriptional regulator, KDG regulon repressor
VLSTVRHAGEVLALFTADRPEWGVTAAARELGIPKSRAHDLLASLTAIGLLEHLPHGRYRLGWRSLALASTQLRTSPLRWQAEPVRREVAEIYTAAVTLFVWDGDAVLCVGRHRSTKASQRNLPSIGARYRANGSAAAKVLLANRPMHEGTALANPPTASRTRSREFVQADLLRVRRRGYAAGYEVGASKMHAFAAPIRDFCDNVIAALSIAGLVIQSHADVALYGDVIVSAAGRISDGLCELRSDLAAASPVTSARV